MKISSLSTRERAYRVPFSVIRRAGSDEYGIVNVGDERVTGVTLTLHGSGVMRATFPSTLEPGASLEVTVVGENLPRDAILVVRWFRVDGIEYVWRVSF